jgi:hypothetical protein
MVRPELPKLLKSRRAVSSVISNIILVAAVITVGFVALGWTYSTSNSYVVQYGNSVQSDSDKLAESIAFEYIFYNGSAKSLSVYIMNCGKVGAVNLRAAYVSNASLVLSNFTIASALKLLNNASRLDIGQEGYFVWSPIVLQGNTSYTVKITTWRGSFFEDTFAA